MPGLVLVLLIVASLVGVGATAFTDRADWLRRGRRP
jgi:hypothetical protein